MVNATIWCYIFGHIFWPELFLVLHICLTCFLVFINVTIIFGVIATFGKLLLLFGNRPYHRHCSHIFWPELFLVLHICLTCFLVFINVTIIFGVIATFGKLLLLFGNRPYHRHCSEHDILICSFPIN